MGLAEFLAGFRELHEKARHGQLDAAARGEYDGARDELASALMQAQKESPGPGQRPRTALKVPKALQVDLGLPGERVLATTVELSARGFAVLLADAPKQGSTVKCSLRLSSTDSIMCEAVVVDTRRQPHNKRVTFALSGVQPGDSERLELLVFDEVLAKLAPPR